MKAAAICEHGGPDCISVQDVPSPAPAAGEVLIDVRAAALNHLDVWVRQGARDFGLTFPHVLGSDAAGVVAELGHGVTGACVGDEVVINPGVHCGRCEHCLDGEHSLCEEFGLVGMSRPGTFAEQIAVPVRSVFPKPAHLSFEQAAALPLSHVTAWRMLMTRAKLRPGETVLIHGIGGGVALAGLQLAKLAGAWTAVTSSSDEKLARAAELGADCTINYRSTEDVADSVRSALGGRGVDVILDSVGAATWPINLDAARKGARIVHCGVTTGADAPADLHKIYWKQLTVMGSTMGSDGDFVALLDAVGRNGLEPVVDSVLPLDDAAPAAARMERGGQLGKIVLHITP